METLDSLITASIVGGIYFTIQVLGHRYMLRVNRELNQAKDSKDNDESNCRD
ncbi:hypothetical protein LCGC14_1336900 [marine sediment metagenome]|uniref:Uncharacterized protein n=1 Tax=marine sediment metagenome TaxID=412755 RepID=A0A0F9NH46_9ZZZZ